MTDKKMLDLLSISTIPDEVKEEQSGGTVDMYRVPLMLCNSYGWEYFHYVE